jgi:DNA-binding MarR family transcriptional regulator
MEQLRMSNEQRLFDIFGSIFLLSQKLQYITDDALSKHNLTTKQFLVLGAVDTVFDDPPSLNDVATVLATSHQNVKQLAKQLEKKGFMEFQRDPHDRRKLLLATTQQNHDFWDSHTEENTQFFRELFSTLTLDEVKELQQLHNKLMTGFDKIYNELRG